MLLAGDIDRGGIFAQLLGTLWLLSPEERGLVRGLIVNKFRGDLRLFADGVRILEERGDVPVLGVVPFLSGLEIPEEDAVALETGVRSQESGVRGQKSKVRSRLVSEEGCIDSAVIRLPHIANFDDFDPLGRESKVRLRYVDRVADLGRPDVVILPGTKTTMADLAWLRGNGLDQAVCGLARNGTAVVGICGGYQMLGEVIRDPNRVESFQQELAGMGLLPMSTEFAGEKATYRVQATIVGGGSWLSSLTGETVAGYEIHMGRSTGRCRPWLEINRTGSGNAPIQDGAMDETGRIWGCYLHGLFANDTFRRTWLASIKDQAGEPGVQAEVFDRALDRLADVLENTLDMQRINSILTPDP